MVEEELETPKSLIKRGNIHSAVIALIAILGSVSSSYITMRQAINANTDTIEKHLSEGHHGTNVRIERIEASMEKLQVSTTELAQTVHDMQQQEIARTQRERDTLAAELTKLKQED